MLTHSARAQVLPDGASLCTAGRDGRLVIWSGQVGDPIELMQVRAPADRPPPHGPHPQGGDARGRRLQSPPVGSVDSRCAIACVTRNSN